LSGKRSKRSYLLSVIRYSLLEYGVPLYITHIINNKYPLFSFKEWILIFFLFLTGFTGFLGSFFSRLSGRKPGNPIAFGEKNNSITTSILHQIDLEK